MRLDGVTGMKAGNDWLPGYILRLGQAVCPNPCPARQPAPRCHREPGSVERHASSWRDERYVGQQLTFSYERKRIMLEESEVSRGLVGKYVDT